MQGERCKVGPSRKKGSTRTAARLDPVPGVVADALAEHAPPFFALEGFHVALEWVGGHLHHDARDAFLNGLGNLAEVFPGVLGQFTDPTHA
jgi:hypothetical protein